MTEDRFSSISGLLNARPERKTATVHHIIPEPVEPNGPEPAVQARSDPAPTSRRAVHRRHRSHANRPAGTVGSCSKSTPSCIPGW